MPASQRALAIHRHLSHTHSLSLSLSPSVCLSLPLSHPLSLPPQRGCPPASEREIFIAISPTHTHSLSLSLPLSPSLSLSLPLSHTLSLCSGGARQRSSARYSSPCRKPWPSSTPTRSFSAAKLTDWYQKLSMSTYDKPANRVVVRDIHRHVESPRLRRPRQGPFHLTHTFLRTDPSTRVEKNAHHLRKICIAMLKGCCRRRHLASPSSSFCILSFSPLPFAF